MDMGENPHPKAQLKREIITIQDLYSQYISSKKAPLPESTLYQYKSWMNDRVTMPLSVQTYRLLLKRKTEGWENDYIFPGKHPSPYLSNPDNYKRDIIETRGVAFCFNGLRKTITTIAESLDIPHYALKALLNHSGEMTSQAGIS
jgi:hypothetical protein